MIVGRIIGWLLVAIALLFAGATAVASLAAGEYMSMALGEFWFRLDAASLNLAQAGIQRHVHPSLWDPVAITVLRLPGWAVTGVPGVALVVLFRRRVKRRRWFARSRSLVGRALAARPVRRWRD